MTTNGIIKREERIDMKDSKKIIKKLDEFSAHMNKMQNNMDKIFVQMDGMQDRMEEMDGRLEEMNERLEKMNGRQEEMDERLEKMNERLEKMNGRLEEMNGRLGRVESKTTDIQLTIENEIRKNIQTIAEGHLDLNRKLDDSLKVNNEKEIMKLHLTHLENEVRQIKERLGEPA